MALMHFHLGIAAPGVIDGGQQSLRFPARRARRAEHHVSTRKKGRLKMGWRFVLGLCAAAALPCVHAQPVDVAGAEALMKKSGCMKCHSVTAKKEGPPFKEVAAKYKGKADAQSALVKHLTTNPKIKVDGKEELHDALKTKNEGEIKNVVAYILSR
jgi:cytochrome c